VHVQVYSKLICGLTLPVLSTVTDLGVNYGNQFSFRPNINSIVSTDSLKAKLILKCFVTRDSGAQHFVRLSAQFWSFLLYYGIFILKWILIKLKASKCHLSITLIQRKIGKTTCTFTNIGDATLMADLTTCYKLLNGLIDIDFVNFLLLL